MKQFTTLVLLLSSTSIVAADAKKPDAKKVDKVAEAKPAPTDAKLAQLVGRWSGSNEFTLRGKKTTWKVTTSCERAAISPAVLCSSVAVSGDMRLEELWMFGFDDHSKTYHLFMTNNWGEAYDHSSAWTDAASVAFVHSATRDGKALVESYTLGFKGDQMTWKGTLKVGDETIGSGTSTLQRIK
jgi:hypothetical protein